MFENLSQRLTDAVDSLRGRGRLTEANIKDTLRQVRMALLEADVALPVVKQFIDSIRERAVGEEVLKSLTPGQALVKLVHDQLVVTMGDANEALNLKTQPPAVVLMAGLQGAGKTTTAAKLAHRLINKERKKVLLASADIYRPAAILQLETLAGQVGAQFEPSSEGEDPVVIAKRAIEAGRRAACDVVIVDTAGRLGIDERMMTEIRAVHAAAAPVETLFVVDSMTGQDAVNAAKAFNDALPLTGVVLTKADGDARGGAALSVRQITGKPIKFIGTGEKIDALDPFHPERVASRILGMGDVVSLVEEVQEKVDRKKADKLAAKVRKGKGFDLSDMKDQYEQMLDMGGLSALMDKLPGAGKLPQAAMARMDDKQLRRQIALINSMTPHERRFPKVINGSRKRRIANGAGLQVQELNRLLKQHLQMQKMMKKFSKGGMKNMLRGMQGRLPPGFGR
ncbi:MAG: signal recognition particle protein [Pseudomonadota bacterium]